MSEQMLITHCSPTLAGIKTGNLFSCHYSDIGEVRDYVRTLNRRLGKRGLCVVVLRYSDQRALIYVYRPRQLAADLASREARSILTPYGYPVESPERCVLHLRHRLLEHGAFPHEIGLFLGYPPHNVRGFMENQICQFVGAWKVYDDAECARRTFARYRKCTAAYKQHWAAGKSLERLTVRSLGTH